MKDSTHGPTGREAAFVHIPGAPDGPLQGRRIALKDTICLAGVPMMNGSPVMEGYTPEIDATIVTRMLDAGANVDCRPLHLLQFAFLGHVYAQDLMGRSKPRIGLLNIGSEPEKGNERTVEAYRLLSQSGLNFVGNVEGRDIIHGRCDVLVTDGFAGNVLLKFYESVAGFVIRVMDREQERIRTPLDRSTIEILDYAEYGGAPLLGVNGVSVICHGRSPPKAIGKAIGVAAKAVRTSMIGHIARYLAETAARIP